MRGPIRKTVRPCPLCGKNVAEELTVLRFALFDDSTMNGTCPWVVCKTCGMSFYDTGDMAESLDDYYRFSTSYDTAATTGAGGDSKDERRRFHHIAQFCERYIEDKNAPIFDIGCGRGGLLSVFKQHGYSELYGVDRKPECCEYIVAHYNIPAKVNTAAVIPFEKVTPSLCIYSHIIEHALHPATQLTECWKRLGDDGLVYVEVPDALRYGEFSKISFSDIYFEHINHFDGHRLDALMSKCGFESVEKGRKEIGVTGGGKAACIYGMYKKGDKGTYINCDMNLGESLRKYIVKCSNHAAFTRLEKLAEEKVPLFIWGMSQYAQLLLGNPLVKRCSIKALIDSDERKQQRTIGGRTIHSPEILRHAHKENAVLLTGLSYHKQMKEYLKKISFQGVVVELD